jgi:sRNA-binding protein
VSRRGSLLALALVAAAAAFVVLRPATPRPATRPAAGDRAGGGPRVPAREPAVDPATVRDVFRFASEPPAARAAVETPLPTPLAAPTPPTGPRLVGLVRRHGALLAAFAVGEDVVLAGAGQQAGGLTVLEVGEDGVRVRLADGREQHLSLP